MKISSSTTGSTSTSPPDEEPPSEELLEFLGEWAGDDGWTDPIDLDDAARLPADDEARDDD